MKIVGKRYDYKGRKIYQSLYGHTYDSLAFLKEYIDKESYIIETLCKKWQIEKADLIKSLFLITLLHDVGKMTETFQKNIKEGKRTINQPHPLAGLPIVDNGFRGYFPKLIKNIEPFDVEAIAILSHHTQAYAGLYKLIDCKMLDFDLNSVNKFLNDITPIYKKLGFEKYFKIEFNEVKVNLNINKTPDELKVAVDYFRGKINELKNKIYIKSIFAFIFSLLKISDIHASINFNKKAEKFKNSEENIVIVDELYESSNDLSFAGITNKMGIWRCKKKRIFQQNLADNPKRFTMLFAPCGRGKTDASLYWAIKLLENKEANRIIFALPTQVTCNAMYNKLSGDDYFGNEKVGLHHSKSNLEFSEAKKEQDNRWHEEIEDHQSFVKNEIFRGEIFFHPITVTTVDHLLYAFIHGYSKADFSLGNIQTSVIIFDEVNYYDKTMLGNLKQLFKILREMKIPHILMSGIFPEFLKKAINESEEYHWEEDSEGLEFTPFEIIKKRSTNNTRWCV